MKNILVTILISAVVFIGLSSLQNNSLGATITTLTSSDNLVDFPASYNTNLSNINTDLTALEATTTQTLVTSIPNLVTVGTIGTGVWNGTLLDVAYGGTGSSTLSQYNVLLGSSTNAIGIVSGLGTNGQFLTSGGAGTPPSWTTSSVDGAIDYTWTGHHIFSSLFATNASSTYATTTNIGLNGIDYLFPSVEGASTTQLYTDGNGGLSWGNYGARMLGYTAGTSTTNAQAGAETEFASITVPANVLGTNGEISFWLSFDANLATNDSVQIRIKYGGTEIGIVRIGQTAGGLGDSGGAVVPEGILNFKIGSNNSTSAQYGSHYGIAAVSGSFYSNAIDHPFYKFTGSASIDSTSDQELSLTYDFNDTTTNSLTVSAFNPKLIPSF